MDNTEKTTEKREKVKQLLEKTKEKQEYAKQPNLFKRICFYVAQSVLFVGILFGIVIMYSYSFALGLLFLIASIILTYVLRDYYKGSVKMKRIAENQKKVNEKWEQKQLLKDEKIANMLTERQKKIYSILTNVFNMFFTAGLLCFTFSVLVFNEASSEFIVIISLSSIALLTIGRASLFFLNFIYYGVNKKSVYNKGANWGHFLLNLLMLSGVMAYNVYKSFMFEGVGLYLFIAVGTLEILPVLLLLHRYFKKPSKKTGFKGLKKLNIIVYINNGRNL